MSEDKEKTTSKGNADSDEVKAPDLLQQAFDVFSQASLKLQTSYDELKIRADKLAKELAQTNEELQRQLEEKERISNFLNNILQSIRSGIIVISSQKKIILNNEVALELFGLKECEEDTDIEDFFDEEHVLEFIANCLNDEKSTPRTTEIEVRVPESSQRRILALAYSSVTNSQDVQVASLLVAQDITRLKLLEEQALRTNRLAAMGEMAAQLAHEIRNPLGSIEIFASLLSRDLKREEDKKLADNIVVGVKSLNAVVTNMLTFTRTVKVTRERVELNELVEETLGFLEQVLKVQDIELAMNLDKDIFEAEVDPELLKQVILNLAQNSIFAMEGKTNGVLTVSTKPSRQDDGQEAVEILVSDNGCGISEEDLTKIFDPFFSTRKGGTGLGLSVVSQIIEKHEGLITAESQVGEGTTMRITLPRSL